MAKITMQGHDTHGWDTETPETMKDVKAFLNHPHHGEIMIYTDRGEFFLPLGIGNRSGAAEADDWEE